MSHEIRLAVLLSGTGSIFEAVLASGIRVTLVASDRPCRGLDVARVAGIDTELVDRRHYGGFSASFDRVRYTARLLESLSARDIELVAMAGFGTVLSSQVHEAYPMRILNTHPSLLPAFPGWHSVAEALESGVDVTGCTVHFATLETDAGPVIAQEEVKILPGDTVDTLHERIKQAERVLYPATIRRVIDHIAAATPVHTPEGARR